MPTAKQRREMAVRYWESRRVAFNLLLVPPALFGWVAHYAALAGSLTPVTPLTPTTMILCVGGAALLANIAYSIAYGLEFLFLTDEHESFWVNRGRALTFASGSLCAFGAAFLGGAKFSSLMALGQ